MALCKEPLTEIGMCTDCSFNCVNDFKWVFFTTQKLCSMVSDRTYSSRAVSNHKKISSIFSKSLWYSQNPFTLQISKIVVLQEAHLYLLNLAYILN